jgi:hypothetical protein
MSTIVKAAAVQISPLRRVALEDANGKVLKELLGPERN